VASFEPFVDAELLESPSSTQSFSRISWYSIHLLYYWITGTRASRFQLDIHIGKLCVCVSEFSESPSEISSPSP